MTFIVLFFVGWPSATELTGKFCESRKIRYTDGSY